MKPQIYRSIQRFFEISPFHGCSYIGYRAAKYEAVIWSVALLLCTGFCINDIWQLCANYNAQVTAVNVVMQRNSTISLPAASICFDVFRNTLSSSISAVFNETTFNKSLTYFGALIKATPDLSQLNTMDNQVDLMLKTTYLLLTAIVDYDIGIPGGLLPYDAHTERAINIIDAFYIQYGFNYEQLFQQTARFLCKQTLSGLCAISDVGFYKTICLDICGQGNITWLGLTVTSPPDDICFALNTNLAGIFDNPEDTIQFGTLYISHVSMLMRDWGTEAVPKISGYGTPKLALEMRAWEGLMDPRSTDSVAYVSEGVSSLLSVSILSLFTVFNRTTAEGKGSCGSVTAAHCGLFTCLPAARMAADGCWPLAGYTLTSYFKPAATPICGRRFTDGEISQINNLGSTNQYTSAWETCIYKNCSTPPCTSHFYEYFTTLSEMGDGVNATFYQGKPAYPVFNEYVIMDFASYLATFGGIMGLWLGGSLISMLHVPVYVICQMIANRCCIRPVDYRAAIPVRQKGQVTGALHDNQPVNFDID